MKHIVIPVWYSHNEDGSIFLDEEEMRKVFEMTMEEISHCRTEKSIDKKISHVQNLFGKECFE
jgi:hypothetical protein